jgi:predicted MPP superfamily phosphohydrolase
LHIGALTPPWWGKRWIDRANQLEADAVVVTGDLVTSGVSFHESIAELIGQLRGKDGVFCAMGNHDYFGEGEPLISLMRERGAKVLRNEGVVIDRAGASFYLAAIDDTWTRRADLDRALAERPADMPTVMLAHDPDRFPQIAKRGVALVLSGHTHGGQIAVPFLARWINASKLAHRFHVGVYRDGDSTLYVHPGLGTTGPPIRLGVAPAIVVLTLRVGDP